MQSIPLIIVLTSGQWRFYFTLLGTMACRGWPRAFTGALHGGVHPIQNLVFTDNHAWVFGGQAINEFHRKMACKRWPRAFTRALYGCVHPIQNLVFKYNYAWVF